MVFPRRVKALDFNEKLLESEEIMSDPFKLLDELKKHDETTSGSVDDDCDGELISEEDFLHMVTAQKETFQRYLRSQKIIPDVLDSKNHRFYYMSSVNNYIEMYGWRRITDKNRKEIFLNFISEMDMSYSYKPVFIKAVLRNANVYGEATVDSIIAFFRAFYEGRRSKGVVVEKPQSAFFKKGYSDSKALSIIIKYPYARFETIGMMDYIKEKGVIVINSILWNQLSLTDIKNIDRICNDKIDSYYLRFTK